MSGAAAGLLAAVLASTGYGLASVLQAVGARRAAAGGAGTAVQPAYLGGLALDGASWLVSLLALRALPLFAVQAVLAGSLAVTAVVGERLLRLRLGRGQRVAVAVVVGGLGVLAAGARPGRAHAAPAGTTAWALALTAALAALGAGTRRRSLSPGSGRLAAAVLATGAGLAYAVAAFCARLLPSASPAVLVAQPAAWAVLAAGAVGTVLYAWSLAGDGVVVATSLLWVVEVVAGGTAGVLLLGDGVRPGWGAPAAAGAVGVLAACAVLARPAVEAGG